MQSHLGKALFLPMLVALLFGLFACSDGGGSSGGAGVSFQLDSDADGIPDYIEIELGSDANDPGAPYAYGNLDADSFDGPGVDDLPDGLERYLLTEGAAPPISARTDSDADGLPDYLELRHGNDPFDASDPMPNGGLDNIDGTGPVADGISDALEQFLYRGTPIDRNTDSDGDGIFDFAEVVTGSDPFQASSPEEIRDLDGDSVPDYFEAMIGSAATSADDPVPSGDGDSLDSSGPSGDGVSDALERALMMLGASSPVTTMTDSDADGIPDALEVAMGRSPFNASDPYENGSADEPSTEGPSADGIPDALERWLIAAGAEPPITVTTDSDEDGITDHVEIWLGNDPFDAEDASTVASRDLDGDGSPDWFELSMGSLITDANDPVANGGNDVNDTSGPGTDVITDALELGLIVAGSAMPVTTATDSDGDGIPDYMEVFLASDILDANQPYEGGDTDLDGESGPAGDGVNDGLEQALIAAGAEAPVDTTTDTDLDGITDVLEVRTGTHPMFHGDPIPGQQQDVDDDGVPDYYEFMIGTNPYDGDDPVLNGGEDNLDGTGPAGDGISDALEAAFGDEISGVLTAYTDTDDDGLPDYLEVQYGSSPFAVDDPIPGGADINSSTGPSNDGISDALEAYLVAIGITGPITSRSDFDSDGVPDYFEAFTGSSGSDGNSPVPAGALDSTDATGPAGDALTDALESALAYGGAIPPVGQYSDSDGDGAPDYLEAFAATHPFDIDDPVTAGDGDADGDGISNALEAVLERHAALADPGADPEEVTTSTDLDDDGVPDFYEVLSAADPTNPNDPMSGGGDRADSDDAGGPSGDVITDALEGLLIQQGATGPISTATDSDDDGVPDYFEVFAGNDPFDADSPLAGGGSAADSDDSTGPAGDQISDALEHWLVDNGAIGPIDETTDSDGDTIPDFVEVNNGTDPFDAESVPSNGNAPTATASILGTPSVGENLSGTYVYADAESNPERGTTYRWLRDDVPIGGATSTNYLLTVADEGTIIRFEVTPRSEVGIPREGLPSSAQIGPIDPRVGTAPEATNVAINGTPELGTQLTGRYDYADDDSDVEGVSEFRWLRDGVAILDATSIQYTIVERDLGTSLTFEVIPVAQTGAPNRGSAGTATIPVNAPPAFTMRAEFTFTGGDETAPLDAALILDDVSGSNVTGATIDFGENYQRGEDLLEFTDTPTISGVFDDEEGTLTLTGLDSGANWQTALRNVNYRSTAGFAPALLERELTWTITEDALDNATGEAVTKIMFGLGSFPEGFDGLSADVLVWLDSSEQGSIYDAEIGGSSASLRSFSGDVHRWEDRSGNGNHATTRTGAAAEMRFAADGLNGLPVVRVDGVAGERLRFDTPFTSSDSSGTIIALHRAYTGTVNRTLADVSNGAYFGLWDTKLAAFTDDFIGTPRNLVNDPTSVRHQYNWYLFRLDGSTGPDDQFCVDGYPLGVGGTGGVAFQTISLGDGGAEPTEPTDSEYAEVIAFDGRLSDLESRFVETVLAAKWGDPTDIATDLSQRVPIYPMATGHRADMAMIGRSGAETIASYQGGGLVIANPGFGGFLSESEDYVCSGHDDATGLSTDDLTDAVQRALRTWRLQFTDATGDGGTLNLHFDRNAFGASGLTISPIQSYVLLFAGPGDPFETIDVGVANGSIVSFHNVPVAPEMLENGLFTIGISD